MPGFELESLLSPLADDAPSGADLEYDPVFLALQTAGAGRPEQQYGETVIAAQEPDWPAVFAHGLDLAARTRDLRVATWLLRSGARLEGWPAVPRGLSLVLGLLEGQWTTVHPQLDASDGNDPTARLNALAVIAHPEGLADLRTASLTGQRAGPRVRDVELAFGRAEPVAGESVPSEQGIADALAAAAAADPGLAASLVAGADLAARIDALLDAHLPGHGPDLAPMRRLLQHVARAAASIPGADVPPPADPAALAADAARGAIANAAVLVSAQGAIASREDAVRALERVCEWYERHEPGHPAPLLIRRAQRLMSKTFLDIVRDLLPDGVAQVERLAGLGND